MKSIVDLMETYAIFRAHELKCGQHNIVSSARFPYEFSNMAIFEQNFVILVPKPEDSGDFSDQRIFR